MKLKLDYPVAPFITTQPFGVNGEYYRAHGINVDGHNGLDLQTYHGQPIYAAHDGRAYYTDNDGNEGDGVVIITTRRFDWDDGKDYFKTIYWHLCDPHKEPQLASPVYRWRISTKGQGMPVVAGQLIGYADNTGFSSGDHLHFGLKPVAAGENPMDWWNIEQNNGYGGAIDPAPYFPSGGLNAWEQVALVAAKEQGAGRSKAAAQLWGLVAFLKAFLV